MPDFDLAVIGAGAAGLAVAATASRLGLRVALIERGRLGGQHLNTGCMPSKALLASAHAVQAARSAGRLGVHAQAESDWESVRAHVAGVIAATAPNRGAAESSAPGATTGATVVLGEARFVARDAVDVGGPTFSARRLVIAAGSRPAVPALPGLADLRFLTSETVFGLKRRPEHLLILGGGDMALEMAQAHAGLGCRVTIVSRARLGRRHDPELVDLLRRRLVQDGVTVLEAVRVVRAEPGPALLLEDGRRIAGSHVLVATGRAPDLSALNLAAGGIHATGQGIATDRGLRSVSNRRVFVVGGIADPAGIGPMHQTHAGRHHADVVIRRAVFRLSARIDPILPSALYTDPELAQVGSMQGEAFRCALSDNDRAHTERRTDGMVKLASVRGRLVGAGIVAPHAGEMIGLLVLAVRNRLRLSALAELVVPYPTLGEAVRRAAGSAFEATRFTPRRRKIVSFLARLP